MRTKKQWLDEFNQSIPHCKWFIDAFFPGKYEELLSLAKKENTTKLFAELNSIWFKLPDSFNIVDNPKGWRKFLQLVSLKHNQEYLSITKNN